MEERVQWFVGRTRYGQELKVRERLISLGIEYFIPTQIKYQVKGGKKSRKERPVINNLVFLRCCKDVACNLVNTQGVPVHYVIDRNTRTLMIVPDKQMIDFQKVFENGEIIQNENQTLAIGDKVRVITGPLTGIEGYVNITGQKTYISVSLGGYIQARTEIPSYCLERIV